VKRFPIRNFTLFFIFLLLTVSVVAEGLGIKPTTPGLVLVAIISAVGSFWIARDLENEQKK
jgi:hypothetical protein